MPGGLRETLAHVRRDRDHARHCFSTAEVEQIDE